MLLFSNFNFLLPSGRSGRGFFGEGLGVRLFFFFFLVINVGAKVRRFYEIYKRLGVLPSTRLKTDMHFCFFSSFRIQKSEEKRTYG